MAGVGRSEEQHQHRTASATENHEVASQDKKYGGIVPKKKPLISKASHLNLLWLLFFFFPFL
ncbi:unnamed protein product [Coffea canephora]|uniref:Uncharacterized protein n=1 Tax=Coffea canephora TaxID=49390 RepID=A0A068TS62_COFCA|nr:unnamed protein product [Coffea canephora]